MRTYSKNINNAFLKHREIFGDGPDSWWAFKSGYDFAQREIKSIVTINDYKETDVNFNHCHEQAIKALRYIAKHGRTASGGEQFPNDECCFQIADELERSFKVIQKEFGNEKDSTIPKG